MGVSELPFFYAELRNPPQQLLTCLCKHNFSDENCSKVFNTGDNFIMPVGRKPRLSHMILIESNPGKRKLPHHKLDKSSRLRAQVVSSRTGTPTDGNIG